MLIALASIIQIGATLFAPAILTSLLSLKQALDYINRH
jgi:hypothetical protein